MMTNYSPSLSSRNRRNITGVMRESQQHAETAHTTCRDNMHRQHARQHAETARTSRRHIGACIEMHTQHAQTTCTHSMHTQHEKTAQTACTDRVLPPRAPGLACPRQRTARRRRTRCPWRSRCQKSRPSPEAACRARCRRPSPADAIVSVSECKAGHSRLSHLRSSTCLGLILSCVLSDDRGAEAVPQRASQGRMISGIDAAIILELVEGTEACLDLSARFRDMSIQRPLKNVDNLRAPQSCGTF